MKILKAFLLLGTILCCSAIEASSIAIILDDAGNSLEEFERLEGVNVPVTIAVLPQVTFSQTIAQMAYQSGYEVMIHMPLEALDDHLSLGPGGIKVDMPLDVIEQKLANNIASVPYAVGVNNHMGSRATSDRKTMEIIFENLKKRGLFFIDSFVVSESICQDVARELGQPCLQRDVFLDNEDDPDYIEQQFHQLIAVAERRGHAIGIGHINRTYTVAVLKKMIPLFKEHQIELRYASEMF